jgi:hypothetical protein
MLDVTVKHTVPGEGTKKAVGRYKRALVSRDIRTLVITLKKQNLLSISNNTLPSINTNMFSNTASKFLLASCVAALGANALPAQSSAQSSEIIADVSPGLSKLQQHRLTS